MSQTVGDFILHRLHDWGVRRLYGFPGDRINGLVSALGRAEGIDFVQTRHEARAAIGAHYHQEVALHSLFKDVAGDYVHTAMAPAQARHSALMQGDPEAGGILSHAFKRLAA